MLHVAQISFFSDPAGRAPEQLLLAWPSLADVAEAAAAAGVRVSVLQACAHTQGIARGSVTYEFLPFGVGAGARADPFMLAERLRELAPDVLHVHGLGFAHDVLKLASLAPDKPILLQDHADRPPRPWRRGSWRRGFAAASALSFCALAQAQPFRRAGLVHERLRVFEIPECPSRFSTGDQATARTVTGLAGEPCVLWVGHLDRNKDPLTVLAGVSAAARQLPQLQLWCCFSSAPLLAQVRARIAADPDLAGRVHLLGRVPHEHIEQLMRAADLFVLGSHREGSGYSLIEALGCGLVPIVSDIPSFRSLTGGGRVGAVWPCGDPQRLAAALVSLTAQPRAALRAACRAHFEAELSFPAVGRKLAEAYQELLADAAQPSSRSAPRHA